MISIYHEQGFDEDEYFGVQTMLLKINNRKTGEFYFTEEVSIPKALASRGWLAADCTVRLLDPDQDYADWLDWQSTQDDAANAGKP